MAVKLGNYDLTVRYSTEKKMQVLDPVRSKFVALTPEEWVRQQTISHLIKDRKVPIDKLSSERSFLCGTAFKRFDVLIFDRKNVPLVLIECKPPHVSLNELVWNQASEYNRYLKAPFLLISNGVALAWADIRTDPPRRMWTGLLEYELLLESINPNVPQPFQQTLFPSYGTLF